MAIIKCKMCGGDLNLVEGASTAQCEYCGCVQTIPNLDDEKKLIQFERAERLRKQCEFDKAAGIYETIVADFRQEAEAYWGLLLCKYGIEYVDDPASSKKIPTCHRSSFESVLEDSDFEQALENADATARKVYREEAKILEEIRKGIVAVSNNEQPYNIFICYKETDAKGDRTLDSVLAQDVYDALTDKGYRVFFSRISLEDKLGMEYEPYIFAALNSAKIMLVFGTDYEYFNAVWVKNEWSRFLKLMAKDKEKHLIPCFKGIDAYDMPKEFAKLQAQDMGKVGAIQDLLRGIEKLIPRKTTVVKGNVAAGGNDNIAPLLKRALLSLEDGDWAKADGFCEQVLNVDPECATAYLYKLMAELRVRKQKDLPNYSIPFNSSNNYQKAVRFGDFSLKSALEGYVEHIRTRNENARVEEIYTRACSTMKTASTEFAYSEAEKLFASIPNYKDVAAQIPICKQKIEEIKAEEKAERIKRERQEEIARTKAKKRVIRKKMLSLTVIAACVIIVSVMLLNHFSILDEKYNKAVDLMNAGKYEEAIAAFEALGSYKDSAAKMAECNNRIQYSEAESLLQQGKTIEAAMGFGALCGYKDSTERAFALWEPIVKREPVSAGVFHTAGLKADGTVVATGYSESGQCNVSGWENIIAISAGYCHSVGLRANGTVMAIGGSGDGQCNVIDWKYIVAISAGDYHTVGLKADGTVVAVGYVGNGQCDVSGWKDIVAISAGYEHTIGLKADGMVVAAGSNSAGQCDVSGWTDIVAISAGGNHTIGLKADGTVVATGSNSDGQCDVSGWKDIVAISAGGNHTIGLKADGTVVATGYNYYGQCDVSGWKDIVAISAGLDLTVGIKADGTVVAAGDNMHGACDVGDWKNMKMPTEK